MESVRRSLFHALGQAPPLDDALFAAKQSQHYRPEARRIWTSKDSDAALPAATSVEDLTAVITSPAFRTTWFGITQRGLSSLDSSACAALLKELCRKGHSTEAFEIFDWLRTLEKTHELTRLLDVYTYTTMIAQCGSADKLPRATEFIQEMRQRGVQCNVHTYTALMHVYAKTDQTDLALGIPELMKKDGCTPNLVTFNTLINLFRKMGEWKRAVDVIDLIDDLNIQAEAKTYNAVIGACSSSGEPAQALYVYQRMLAKNVQPSATTYTALISAHGKKGLIEDALAIFNDMVQRGCERNVITYSSLIGACERTGQSELAFELFHRMKSEGIQPNIITFNSMITACANGSQWARALDVYTYMVQDGCRPDPTTYLTLLGALMKGGGQWTTALGICEDMQRNGYTRPDHVTCQVLLEILWASGEKSAHVKAVQLWNTAQENGTIKFAIHSQGKEFSVEVFTCGAAVITLLMWLKKIRTYYLDAEDLSLVLKCGRRSVIDQNAAAIRDALGGILEGLNAPFAVWSSDQTLYIKGISGEKARLDWYNGMDCCKLMHILEEAISLPPLTTAMLLPPARSRLAQCTTAYRSVLEFEAGHKIYGTERMLDLMKDRSSIVRSAYSYATGFGFQKEAALDAVWLFDRLVASEKHSLSYIKDHLHLIICVCVLSIGTVTESNTTPTIPQGFEFTIEDLVSVKAQMGTALNQDLCAISPMRILNLFWELLGSYAPLGMFMKDEQNSLRSVITRLAYYPLCWHLPSSQLACCIFYEFRKVLKIYPYWPTDLAHLTGFSTATIEDLVQRHSALADVVTQQFSAVL